MSKIIFETKNFYLREFQDQDFDLLFKLWNCPEILDSVESDPLNKTQIQEKLIRYQNWMKKYGFSNFAVFKKDSNEFVGSCGFSIFHDPKNDRNPLKDRKKEEVELGYILKQKFWNQGFGNELVSSSLKYIFDNFENINQIIAVTTLKNLASQKILHKNSFQFIKKINSQKYGPENFYLLKRQDFS